MRLSHLFIASAASLQGVLAISQLPLADETLMINGVTFETRVRWMRLANQALGELTGTPCPFAAFGTVIVNHTSSDEGELICMGVNENSKTGNPSSHGQQEIPSLPSDLNRNSNYIRRDCGNNQLYKHSNRSKWEIPPHC